MGAKSGDGMANHHLIPEELMKAPEFKPMFSRLNAIGFKGDGPSNGMFLPGKEAVKTIDLPGHWTSHKVYTSAVRERLQRLGEIAPSLSDLQLGLGVKSVQDWARAGLQNGTFKVNPTTGGLM